LSTVTPVAVSIVRNNLLSTAREMRETIIRTSPATVIYEMLDFACGILDAEAGLLTEASGLTQFVGTLSPSMKKCVEKLGRENLEDGDVILVTAPMYTGSHPPEAIISAPIFYGNKLFGYANSKGHLVDMGGKDPYPTDSTDAFMEGLRLPPVKLFRKGKLNEEIKDTLELNSRAPEIIWGELQAQIGAASVAKQRVTKLLDKYGFEKVTDCVRKMNESAEEETRESLLGMTHGSWSGEDFLDDNGVERGKRVPIKVTCTASDDKFTMDYSGSDAQQKGPTNTPIIQTISVSRLMFKFLTAPHTPAHEGSFKRLEVVAPYGSIFNVDTSIAPTMLYGWATRTAMELMFKILAPVFPDRLSACSSGCLGSLTRYGYTPKGKFWSQGSIEGIGQGASNRRDGANVLLHMTQACSRNLSCEVEEALAPMLVERYELLQDSGGPGRFRGGLGVRRDWRYLASGKAISLVERSVAPHWGVEGGKPGSRNIAVFTSESPEVAKYAVATTDEGFELIKSPSISINAGDVVSTRVGGGGGWGDPFERDVEAVRRDVVQGYVSLDAARREYGVVLDAATLMVDSESTMLSRGDSRHTAEVGGTAPS